MKKYTKIFIVFLAIFSISLYAGNTNLGRIVLGENNYETDPNPSEDITLQNDGYLSNYTDHAITLSDNSEDLIFTFGLNSVTLSSSTSVNSIMLGEDDTGYDLKLYGATSGNYFLWDENEDMVSMVLTSATTTGTDRGFNLNFTQTGASASKIIEALRVNIDANVMTGDWVNAIVARIDYGASGNANGGMVAPLCAELSLPPATLSGGAYYVADLEIEAPENYISHGNVSYPTAWLNIAVYGNATAIGSLEDNAFLFRTDGFTSGTGNMIYNNTIRARVENTTWYSLLSDAEGEFSTAYLIDVSNSTDASNLTTASIATDGGLAVTKQLYLGDDLDMSVNGTGTYDITLMDNVADALSIVRGTTDMIVFTSTTASPLITITPATTITGALTSNGGITISNAVTGITIAGGGNDIPLIIGTKSNSASQGLVLVGVAGTELIPDNTGGVQIFADDGGAAAVAITSPIWTRYLLTKSTQTSGATQTGAYLQLKTSGSQSFTTGSITALKAYNQAGTVTLLSGAEYGIINAGMSLEGNLTNTSGKLAGIDININGGFTISDAAVNSAALMIRKVSGSTAVWPVGIYIQPTGSTNALRVGIPSTTAGNGMPIGTAYDATGAKFGIYFDDGGVALSTWGEGFTVGLVTTQAITASGMTGMPYTGFFYTDMQAAADGIASAGWSTVMTSFCVSGNLSGFEVGVSSLHSSVDVNASKTLATETTLAAHSFGGNWWSGSLSGKIVPLDVRSTNQPWSAFLHMPSADNGCFETTDTESGGTTYRYLRIYIGDDLYTVQLHHAD